MAEDTHSTTQLEVALRARVQRIMDSGQLEELTVRRVRTAVEHELQLCKDFFKQGDWKTRSKTVIEEEALKTNTTANHSQKPSPMSSKSSSRPHDKIEGANKRTILQSIEHDEEEDEDVRPAKRRSGTNRTIESDDDGERDTVQESKPKPKMKSRDANGKGKIPVKKSPNRKVVSDDDMVSEIDVATSSKKEAPRSMAYVDDSDLSEVFDELPKPKRQKKSSDGKAKSQPKKQTKNSKSHNNDPQAEEIKELQRWLSLCGIKKVWGTYLKAHETPRDKIKHLKEMLADAGMTGRYSKEKAESIREARELAADLEAVQEGARRWGTEAGTGRGR